MSVNVKMKDYMQPILLILAILLGSLTGVYIYELDEFFVELAIIALLFFVFYNVPLGKITKDIKNRKFLGLAWISNFIIIPLIAFLIASIFVDNSSLVFVGLIIYLVAPCTDWVLGFTKLAKGDVELSSILLPINLISQIILLPVYLYSFSANAVEIPFDAFFETLIFWVLIPFLAAKILYYLVSKTKKLHKSTAYSENLATLSLVSLVFFIFNSNIAVLTQNINLLPQIFIVILMFFVVTYYLIKYLAKYFELKRKEEITLSMTTAARNAPLMLGISLVLFPDASLIHLVLIIGMLVEFPHLITLTHLLKKN
ncbi:MAG: arsenic resistance protein [Candidatus Woesearchaeota archaeon]